MSEEKHPFLRFSETGSLMLDPEGEIQFSFGIDKHFDLPRNDWIAPAPEKRLARGFTAHLRNVNRLAELSAALAGYDVPVGEPISTSQAVANRFLSLANSEGTAITPLRLIKLVCIAHGWALALLNRPLVDEQLQAWNFGPVIPSLYHEFKDFRKNPITRFAIQYDFTGEVSIPQIEPDNVDASAIVDRVWELYRHYSAGQLVALTHAEGTPWSLARLAGSKNISDRTIRDHYRDLLAELMSI